MPAATEKHLERLMTNAARIYHRAMVAHERGTWTHHNEMSLTSIAAAVANLLEDCDHGRWPDLVKPDTVKVMREYVEEATTLLKKSKKRPDGVYDESTRIKYGWETSWVCQRLLVIDGESYLHEEPCVNPALGWQKCEAWEQEMRATLKRQGLKKAA